MKARGYGIWAGLAIVAAITSGALLAQAPQAIGTWVSVGDLSSPLTNGAAVALPDKRTLIAGGALVDGTLTDAVTIYDSVDDSATAAGTLTSARADHTATLLKDGRVLVVGGMTVDGLISSDIEIFDPATGTSAIVALLPEPRNGHVAAALPNGNVLIAGGATVDGTMLQTAVLFDPETSGVSSVPGHLHSARVHASATTMLDGRVLVAGGSNGTTELASAEIYDRYSQSFSIAATQMSVGRQRHSAVLLPDNGGVLVAGGTSSGVAQAGVDLFLPAVFPDPFSYGEGEFTATGAMTAARSRAVAGPTSIEGYAFAAAGGAPDAEVYRFATIKTDKDDYAPGELATITGSGWQANEEVTLLFQEDPAVHDDYMLKVNADTNGNVFWNQWAPEHHDLGVRFYLTATGSQSRAQMTFTDAENTTTALVSSVAPSTVGQLVTFAATVTRTPAGTAVPAGLIVQFRQNATSCTSNNGQDLGSVALNPSGQAAISIAFNSSGSFSIAACFEKQGDFQKSGASVTQVVDPVSAVDTTTTPVTATATFGDPSVTLTANVTSTSPVNAGTMTFTVKQGTTVIGTAATSGTISGGNASVNYSLPAGTGAGAYTIEAVYNAGTGFSTSSGNAALTVNPALATVTTNAKSKTYGDDNPALDAVVGGALNGDTLDYSLATTAVKFSAVGSYPITVTLGTNPNYTVTTTDAQLTVSPAVATVTANAKSKTYGDDNPALDAVVVGAVNGDTLDYSLATTALKTSGVGSYPIEVTLGGNPNYTVTSTNGTLTVDPALATVTANAKSKTYGDDNPALDAVVVGAVNGDTLDYSLATTALKTSGVGSYPIEVTLGGNPNYRVTSTNGTLTVNPALATVTANAKSKTYGDDNPALDAVVVGAVNGDALDYSLATTAVKFSAVGTYPITVTLGSNPNYTITTTDAQLTVSPAVATVTANAKSKTYGDDNPALDAVVVGAVNGDTLDYSLATTALKTSGVGSYPITVTLGTNPNYTVNLVNSNLTIGKRTLTVTPDGGKTKTLGEVFTAFTGTVAGLQGTDTGTATYASLGAAAGATIGSYDITVTFIFTNGSQSNYDVELKTAVKGLVVLYRWDGFLQPINDTAHEVGLMSKFKAGQTIPAKFVLKNAAGASVQQTGIPTFTYTGRPGACDSIATLENPEPASADVGPQYKWDGSQYHYNWSTKGLPAGPYRIFANIADGTARSVDICLTK